MDIKIKLISPCFMISHMKQHLDNNKKVYKFEIWKYIKKEQASGAGQLFVIFQKSMTMKREVGGFIIMLLRAQIEPTRLQYFLNLISPFFSFHGSVFVFWIQKGHYLFSHFILTPD